MIKDNLAKVRGRIRLACLRANREVSAIKLVAVTKGRPIGDIKEALTLGLSDIGENRVQEALLKYRFFKDARWHMIGHLQSNKVKEAVRIFDLIQSVDTLDLALAINKEAFKANKVQDVLLEVKLSPEATKFGLKPGDLLNTFKEVGKLGNVRIKGFMSIAPLADRPEDARPYFRALRELRDKIDKKLLLSMGMSDDFEIAVEEGADIIRVGRAIFNE